MPAKVTRGPNGPEIKLKKNNDLFKEIAQGLLPFCEIVTVKTPKARSEKVYLCHDIANKIIALEHHPTNVIPKMEDKGYLVIDSKSPEAYYIFTIPGQGKRLKPHIAAK